MNYTTSDYLEQLVQDRDDLVDNLTTKGITGLTGDETFTELVPEVLNIPSGGDLSEYFSTTIGPGNNTTYGGGYTRLIKKMPPITSVSGTSIASAFNYYNGTEIDISQLNTSNVTNFGGMFYNAENLETIIGLNNLNTSSATNMANMFRNCHKLSNIDLSSFNFSNVTVFSNTFTGSNGSITTTINFGTNKSFGQNVNMNNCFANNFNIKSIDFSGFNTISPSNITEMFYNCAFLEFINLSSFDFSSTTGLNNNFLYNVPYNCLIIVADDTQKGILTTQFPSRADYIKTVAEYEAS